MNAHHLVLSNVPMVLTTKPVVITTPTLALSGLPLLLARPAKLVLVEPVALPVVGEHQAGEVQEAVAAH
jgi:hypothetical protein